LIFFSLYLDLTNLFPTHFSNQDQLTSRQSSLERIPAKHSTLSHNSRSLNSLYDRIQRERKAHTIAPLARISGPSSSPQAKMFATINPPTDNQINRSNHSQISNQKSDIEMTDDNTPIIVKVRYDPQTGVRPSEDAVRKALDNQIFDRKTEKNPIVLHFFGQNSQLQLSNRMQQNSFPSGIPLQSSRTSLSMPHPFLYDKNIRPVQPPKPFINHQKIQSLQIRRLPNRNISSLSTNESARTGLLFTLIYNLFFLFSNKILKELFLFQDSILLNQIISKWQINNHQQLSIINKIYPEDQI